MRKPILLRNMPSLHYTYSGMYLAYLIDLGVYISSATDEIVSTGVSCRLNDR